MSDSGLFQLVSAARRPAVYVGVRFEPNQQVLAMIDHGADIETSELGKLTDEEVYLVNLSELGKSTHDLDTLPSSRPLLFAGIRHGTATDGKAVYCISGFQIENC